MEAAIDRAALAAWIQAHHLEEEAVSAARRGFEEHPARLLRLSHFLRPEVAEALGRFLTREAAFERVQGILSRNGPVPREEWAALADADRLFSFERLTGPQPAAQLSPCFIEFARLRKALESPDSLHYFSRLSGLPLEALSGFTAQSLGPGDYLRPHQDAFARRKVAFILYLNPEWRPEYGGALRVVDHAGGEHLLPVEFNSLVLFDVHTHEHHEILPIEPSAGEQRRMTVGGWYGGSTGE